MDVASKKPLLENLMIMLALKLRRPSMISYSSILKVMTIEHNGPYEHHSNLLSWRQSLGEVIEIGMDEEGLMDIDDLKLQLQFYQTTGRPMLGSFSACSIVTGICSVLCLACFTSLELSHALISQQDIDMRSAVVDGYDAITLSPHKFLGRPGSPGILLMNKALYQLKNSPPSTCGTVNYVNYYDEKDTVYINDIEEREHAGTPQII
ncbi:pyridoxal phosphate-dependent transferase [Tanacetum coccineum]